LELGLASLNTAVLLTSSLTMAMTEPFLERGKVKHAAFTLLLTALLGALFFGLKCYEYHLDFLKGLMPGFRFEPSFAAPKGLYLFFSLYLLLTGLHAVHLTIGVAWCGAMVVSLAQKKPSAQASLGRVSVLGLYWHFVDIVWVFLLPLLYLVGGKG
jgi:cytochrome c oxidase subunit 3